LNIVIAAYDASADASILTFQTGNLGHLNPLSYFGGDEFLPLDWCCTGYDALHA